MNNTKSRAAIGFKPSKTMTNIESLKTKIINRRQAGVFHFESGNFDPIDAYDIPASLDAFVTRLGYKAINDQWIEINISDARHIIVQILKEDLAYNYECMSEKEANTFVEEIFTTLNVDQGAQFFTNGNYYEEQGNSWCPITNATFDTGVLILNGQKINLVWVEDED